MLPTLLAIFYAKMGEKARNQTDPAFAKATAGTQEAGGAAQITAELSRQFRSYLHNYPA